MASTAVTQDTFESEVLQSSSPVLVDFWAEWCGPCKAIAPVLEELSIDLEGRLKIAKVDIDKAHELAAQFKIMSIPTMIIFKGGEPVEQIVGAIPKDQILEKINAHI